ncbi:choice-of-anchor D domain-containing protein, partial [bacterium]|nr:choice-of-anchor D domain-containing protein [bacterium]
MGWTATKPVDCNWLTLTNTSGSDDDTFLLDASIQGVPVGTYSTIVTIADPHADNMTVEIPVLLTINPIPVPEITVTPTALSFSATEGGSNPAVQELTITNSGDGTLNWSAAVVTGGDWATVNPVSGSDNSVVSVTVDISGLSADTYSGSIEISDAAAGNTPVTVPVLLTVENVPEPTGEILAELEAESSINLPQTGWIVTTNDGENCLQADVNYLAGPNAAYQLDYTFTVPQGISEVYVFAEVDVNGTGNDDSFWITLNGDDRCKWNNLSNLGDGWNQQWVFDLGNDTRHSFAVSPGSNTLNMYPRENGGYVNWLVVTTNPNLDIHNFVFQDTPPPPPEPLISVIPGVLAFSGMTGNSNPAGQILTVQNSGTGTLNWNAAKINAAAWLDLSTTTGTDNDQITVSVDITSLTDGVYQDTIQIIDSNADNSPINVPISLTLTAPIPTITITPENLSFTAIVNGTTPAAQALIISNSGTGDLNWIADCLNTSAWLSLTNTSGTNSGAVTVNVVLSGLTAGTYTDTIRVRDENASNSPVTVPVTLTVSDTAPELTITPQTLTFSAMENGANPAAQAVSISNIGTGTINWEAVKTNNAAWLTIAPTSGTGSGSISLAPNISAFAPGTYTETIQIIDTLAVNSPQNVSITLTVSAEPTGPTVAEFNAEASISLPKTGWQTVENEGSTCILATVNDLGGANAAYQLDYEFTVADGVTEVYVFAELDVNGTGDDDSFWITLNGGDRCKWNNLSKLGDGWNQQWVYNLSVDTQHTFPVTPGVNTLSLFPREDGGYVNWLVITTDPNEDIHNYEFGGGTPPPPPVPQISVNPSSLVFVGLTGETPATQNITISNSGSGTLSWTAAKAGGSGWFTMNNTAGASGGSISIDI